MMELSPARDKILYQELLFTERAVSEETMEMIVPDAQPDIARLIGTDAEVFVRGKDADGGKVTVHGVARVAVLYAPDGETGVNRVVPEIPFTVSLADARINAGTRVVARVWAEQSEAVTVNPRKVSARVTVCAAITCFNEVIADVPTARGMDDYGEIELMTAENEVTLPCDVREKTLVITDEVSIPSSNPTMREMLFSRCALVPEETKVVGSKLIVRGTAHTDIVYASIDGEAYTVAFKTEFSQILELERANADSSFDIVPLVTGAYIDPATGADADMQRFSIEIHAVCQLVAASRVRLQYLSDAYGTRHNVETVVQPVSFRCVSEAVSVPAVMRGTLPADGVVRVVSVSARVLSAEVVTAAEARAQVAVTVLYAAQDGLLHTVAARLETTAALALVSAHESSLRVDIGRDIYGVTADGGIEVRVPLDFTVTEMRPYELAPISMLSCDEDAVVDNSERPSLVIARARSGDTLWSIAKRYRATRVMIREANTMEDDNIAEGAMLIIPRRR